jgi:hypothetical protein
LFRETERSPADTEPPLDSGPNGLWQVEWKPQAENGRALDFNMLRVWSILGDIAGGKSISLFIWENSLIRR